MWYGPEKGCQLPNSNCDCQDYLCTGAVGFKRPFEEATLSWPHQMTVQECGQQTVGKLLWKTRHCRRHGGWGCPRLPEHRVGLVPDNRVGDKRLKSQLSGFMWSSVSCVLNPGEPCFGVCRGYMGTTPTSKLVAIRAHYDSERLRGGMGKPLRASLRSQNQSLYHPWCSLFLYQLTSSLTFPDSLM